MNLRKISSVMGALNRKQHSPIPNVQRIDWKWTIGRNLKNYNKQLNKLIPERVYYFEGGKKSRRMSEIVESGAKALCLLALSDEGKLIYDEAMAKKLVAIGVPCFSCSPGLLPEFLESALKGDDLGAVADRIKGAKGV